MSVEWFKYDAAGGPGVGADGETLLFGSVVPVSVRLPGKLGGGEVNVIEQRSLPCPMHKHDVPTLVLANGMYMARCDQFYWYKKEEKVF